MKGKFLQFLEHWRDVARVLLGRDDVTRTSMGRELTRLREHRLAEQKRIEEDALDEVRGLVAEMKVLESELLEMEKAANKWVDQVGDIAKDALETQLKLEREYGLKAIFERQETVLESAKSNSDANHLHTLEETTISSDTKVPVSNEEKLPRQEELCKSDH